MELRNSTILITGGTSGIGLEFVRQLTNYGAKIIVTGRSVDKLNETKRLYPEIHTFQNDVSKPSEIAELYAQVIQQFPQLNIVINNAGIMRNLNLQDAGMSLENITLEIETNLSGTVRMVHQFLPHLKKQRSAAIVNVTSGLAFLPFPLSPIYSATKSALHAYTQVLRLQLKKTNVKVFELIPPLTETTLVEAFTDDIHRKSAGPAMKVDKMVRLTIKGLLNDQYEIKPGLAKAFKLMGRIAPRFFLNYVDKTLQKAKAKKARESR